MADEVWRREPIQSPCIRLCVVDPESGLCLGCHRSTDEIAGWTAMSPEARRAVMADLPDRAAQHRRGRRGGRAGRLGRIPGEGSGRE